VVDDTALHCKLPAIRATVGGIRLAPCVLLVLAE
jgi:hypothetical protein